MSPLIERRRGDGRENEGRSDAPPSRYEAMWDEYARFWDAESYFRRFRFLGDEWGPDDWVKGIVDAWAAPYLRPESRALELGPGGGRYTVRLAPLCAELACVDVSGEMLARLERRLAHFGHVAYAKGNGRDLGAIESRSVDFVFSFNVFVQLTLEDVFGYLTEIERVLTPRGAATIHYACLSGEEGFAYFLSQRERWAADPGQRGRFGMMTLGTLDLLADRAGLAVARNEVVGRDAMAVLRRRSAPLATPGERALSSGAETRRDYRFLDRHLDDLGGDAPHDPRNEKARAAAREIVDRLVRGLDVKSALEFARGTAHCLDRLKEQGIATRAVTLADDASVHATVAADPHFSGLPERDVDLVVARHVLERSPMPLLLLMEMRRLTRRYAIVAVPRDDETAIGARGLVSVFSKPLWRKLFTRARFRIVREEDAASETGSAEWRFLLERI